MCAWCDLCMLYEYEYEYVFVCVYSKHSKQSNERANKPYTHVLFKHRACIHWRHDRLKTDRPLYRLHGVRIKLRIFYTHVKQTRNELEINEFKPYFFAVVPQFEHKLMDEWNDKLFMIKLSLAFDHNTIIDRTLAVQLRSV